MSRKRVAHDTIIIVNQKKREVGIFLSITLVVLILLIVFPIRLMALKVVQINNEIEGKRKVREQLDKKIRNYTQLNTEYQEIKDELKDFPLMFPSQGDYSLFVSNLDEICKANYFRLESVNVRTERPAGAKETVSYKMLNFWSVNINVVGRRSDIVRLMEDIENLPMYPTVSIIGYRNELDESGFLNFSISLKVYGVNKPSLYLDI